MDVIRFLLQVSFTIFIYCIVIQHCCIINRIIVTEDFYNLPPQKIVYLVGCRILFRWNSCLARNKQTMIDTQSIVCEDADLS